jgi:hypothetical protein
VRASSGGCGSCAGRGSRRCSAGKSNGLCALDGWRSIASNAITCSGTARRLASVFVHVSRPLVNERRT